MKLCQILRANLNKEHWDRRVWEIGYRGTPLPKRKATGQPPFIVNDARVKQLRDRFEREYQVMRWLCTPYLTKETEKEYIEKHGTFLEQKRRERHNSTFAKMPGDAKKLNTHGDALPRIRKLWQFDAQTQNS
ncbi:hypothetical protein M3Y97_00976800 [Aphelenchoides bicaudatus]|nr:hypothetical protein M3Y97_00976800 [Aphelenchoides bicaudatus]